MSGGLLANQLLRETGVEISAALVERLKKAHAAAYETRASTIRPLPGAIELWPGCRTKKFRGPSQRAGIGRPRRLLLLPLASIRMRHPS